MRCKRCTHSIHKVNSKTSGNWWRELQVCPYCLTSQEQTRYTKKGILIGTLRCVKRNQASPPRGVHGGKK